MAAARRRTGAGAAGAALFCQCAASRRRERAEARLGAPLATLDLAVLLLEAGENAEVRALAGEIVAVFESLKVHR